MTTSDSGAKQDLRDEETIRWACLEEESEPCIVVSERMELVYMNAPARELVPGEWFARRCFEVLPVVDKSCALRCPTIRAVNESAEIAYCEENVRVGDNDVAMGVGLIPIDPALDDRGRALLVLRRQPPGGEPAEFRAELLRDAAALRERVAAHL